MAESVSEVYKTEREYEAMTIEELTEKYNDLDLRHILMRVFNLASVVYFIDKAQKLTYISQPDQRPTVLAAGEGRQAVHRDLNRENHSRPGGTMKERLEEETVGRSYRVMRIESKVGNDVFTGRSIRRVYVIQDVVDGAEFEVSRGTCSWLAEHGRLEGGFEATKGRLSAAHSAGMKAASDMFADAVPAAKVSAPKRAKEKAEPEEAVSELSDAELDDLLNSLPS